jgi:hypothetical protein
MGGWLMRSSLIESVTGRGYFNLNFNKSDIRVLVLGEAVQGGWQVMVSRSAGIDTKPLPRIYGAASMGYKTTAH